MSDQDQKKPDGMELFKQALNEAMARKIDKEIAASPEPIEFSDNHKRWANHYFREIVGSDYVPYPEMNDSPEQETTEQNKNKEDG